MFTNRNACVKTLTVHKIVSTDIKENKIKFYNNTLVPYLPTLCTRGFFYNIKSRVYRVNVENVFMSTHGNFM